MVDNNNNQERKILMFPFMAQGHINPFMALAKVLAKRKGYKIIIVNTPLNIQKLKSSFPEETEMNVGFAEVSFNGTDYGLPHGTENTDALSYDHMVRLLEGSENLQFPFKKLVMEMIEADDGRVPVCIVSDMFLGWTVNVAKEFGIFHSVFIAGAGYSMAAYFSVSLCTKYAMNKEEFLSLTDFPEVGKIQSSTLGYDLCYSDDAKPWFCFRERQFLYCLQTDAILLNSVDGLGEDVGETYFSRKMGGKPVWNIGPVCCNLIVKKGFRCNQRDVCEQWLDLHPPGSVLYVSFGSQNTISCSQMIELALGLESSGKPFIWVVKPPVGFSMNEEFRPEWLPDEFEERVRNKNQGVLIREWAPQLEILSHRSTSTFLSHCGWNSVLESLSHGIPIIGWPLAGEQFFNTQMLEKEVGVCMEIARGMDWRIVTEDRIAKTIKLVMEKTEEGEKMRRKALEMMKKMADAIREEGKAKGSSVCSIDEFLNTAIVKNNNGSNKIKNGLEN